MKTVLLYYKYTHIENPEQEKAEQLRFCKNHNIKGRIILAHEGINGTASGDPEDMDAYKEYLQSNPLFTGIEFKEGVYDEHTFKKLNIKVRPEIVSLKADEILDPLRETGTYIEPEGLHEVLESDEEYYIIDVRNNYESYIGKFKDSIALDIDNFRDLPKVIPEIEHLKDKKVITVCTGGIRCEKASAYLIKKGFKDVSQLHGGIITYGQKYPDEGFEGKCYVFDSRIAIDINTEENKKIISECYHCHKPEDRYINCCNAECNRQFVCCSECEKEYAQGCSRECQQKSRYSYQTSAQLCLEEHTK